MSEEKSQNDRKSLLKVLIYIMIILAIMGMVWLLPRIALGTSTPFFSVSSNSMAPTLNVGDYIVVKAEPFDNLNLGDIIVFYSPWNPNDIIVHRIYDIRIYNGQKVLITKGDNNYTNPYPDPWYVTQEHYIGKYTGFKIPYLGYLALLFPYPVNYILILFIIVMIFIMELSYEKKEKDNFTTIIFKG
ncbi:MAG: signal peptidase I [Nitrososphaerales archaeon]